MPALAEQQNSQQQQQATAQPAKRSGWKDKAGKILGTTPDILLGRVLGGEAGALKARKFKQSLLNGLTLNLVPLGDFVTGLQSRLLGETAEDGGKVKWLAKDHLENKYLNNLINNSKEGYTDKDLQKDLARFRMYGHAGDLLGNGITTLATMGGGAVLGLGAKGTAATVNLARGASAVGKAAQAGKATRLAAAAARLKAGGATTIAQAAKWVPRANALQTATDAYRSVAGDPENKIMNTALSVTDIGADVVKSLPVYSGLSVAAAPAAGSGLLGRVAVPAAYGAYGLAEDNASRLLSGEKLSLEGLPEAAAFAAGSLVGPWTAVATSSAVPLAGPLISLAKNKITRHSDVANVALAPSDFSDYANKVRRDAANDPTGKAQVAAEEQLQSAAFEKYLDFMVPDWRNQQFESENQLEEYLSQSLSAIAPEKKARAMKDMLAQGVPVPPEFLDVRDSGLGAKDTMDLLQTSVMQEYLKDKKGTLSRFKGLYDLSKMDTAARLNVLAKAAESNPAIAEQVAVTTGSIFAKAIEGGGPGGVPFDAESLSTFAQLPDNLQKQALSYGVYSTSAEDQAKFISNALSASEGMSGIPDNVLSNTLSAVADRIADPADKEYGTTLLNNVIGGITSQGSGADPQARSRVLSILKRTPAESIQKVTRSLAAGNPKQAAGLLSAFGASAATGETPEGFTDTEWNTVKGAAEAGFKQATWDAVKANPLKNLPVAAALWAQSKGWDGAASVLSNPVLFYGGVALLLFGGTMLAGKMLGGFGQQQAQPRFATLRQTRAYAPVTNYNPAVSYLQAL